MNESNRKNSSLPTIFITGVTGFIGQHFQRKLAKKKYQKIFCLVRDPQKLPESLAAAANLTVIPGDILETEKYKSAIAESDQVVHLAAATGKFKPNEYFRINTEGTRRLVAVCQQAGAPNFLYISSIAAKFSNKYRYYYALSKLEAEEIVRQSGLNFAIVRPTIVIGKEAQVWQSFLKLGLGPFLLMFGNGRVKIQPISVEDLTNGLLHILENGIFNQQLIELGGPEQLSIEEFIRRLHKMYFQRTRKTLHLPLGFIIPVLSLLEKPFYSLLPFNVGQLSSFRNDGTAQGNPVFEALKPGMKTVDEMIQLIASDG